MACKVQVLLPLLLGLLLSHQCDAWTFPLTSSRHHSPVVSSTNYKATTRLLAGNEDTTIAQRKPQVGSVVTIDCLLTPEGDFVPEPLFDGICVDAVLDNKSQHLSFVLGEGNYLPGLHEVVESLELGASAEVSLDAGWGDRNPNLVATLRFEDLGNAIDKSQIKIGVQLMLANGLKAVVTVVNDEDFEIDANPPMAGASYRASVKLLNIEEGPVETVFPAPDTSESRYQVATFALGCFWGGELAFMRQPGVVGTKVGYSQGHAVHPSYEEVCSGTSGHTEAIMVKYDPDNVSFDDLCHLAMDRLGESKYLLNQVGNDKGTQYRHGIYFHTDEQKEIATAIKKSFGETCATECLPAKKFWDAESYHQQYLLKGGQSARKNDKSVIRCYG